MKAVMPRACATCPFRRDVREAFAPETLEATVGTNLLDGYAHRCHSTLGSPREKVCAGFTRFCHDTGTPNRMLDMAVGLGLLSLPGDLDTTSDLETGSWEAVKAMHQERLKP